MINFCAPYFFAVELIADILAMDHELMVDILNLPMHVERDYNDLINKNHQNYSFLNKIKYFVKFLFFFFVI